MTKEWLRKTYVCPSHEQICYHALSGELDMIDAADLLVGSDAWEYILLVECPEIEVLEEMTCELHRNPEKREAIAEKYRATAMKAFYDLLDVLTMPPCEVEITPSVKHPIPRSTPQDSPRDLNHRIYSTTPIVSSKLA